jgi:hypothetical protein
MTNRTLTIPDDLYDQLEWAARSRHLDGVEQLLRQVAEEERNEHNRRREEAVRRVDALREQIQSELGDNVPDVVELIRQGRER